jgi:hypothetical protein
MLEDRGQLIHVTAPGRRRVKGIVVHQAPLEGERLRRLGIVVTTPGRTLVDLADVVRRRRTLERAFDEADYLRLDWQSARPRHGRRGSGLLASVLAVHEPGSTRTLSDFEEWFIAFSDERGFRRPEVNVRIEGYLCDFAWREERVIVETMAPRRTARRGRGSATRSGTPICKSRAGGVMRLSSVRLFREPDAVQDQLKRLLVTPAPAALAAPHPR